MRQILLLVAASLSVTPAPAFAQHDTAPQYERDVISVVTLGRHSTFPTASCLVWANAEGFGVGPAQLHGYHGVSMQMNLQPMPGERNQRPTTFSDGLTELKSEFPGVPPWIIATLQKNRGKIEAGCAADRAEPYVIHKITGADRR